MLLYEQIMLNEDATVLNELYVGKTSGILEIEKLCGELIEVTKTENASATKSDTMTKLNAAICKEFGFVSSEISILPMAESNACTFTVHINPAAIRQKTDIYAYNEKTGIKFNTKYKFRFSGSISAVLITRLTAPQLTAILLHEIGHNFHQIEFLGQDKRAWLSKVLDGVIELFGGGKDPKVIDMNEGAKRTNSLIIKFIPKDFGDSFKLIEKLHKVYNAVNAISMVKDAAVAIVNLTTQVGWAFMSRLTGSTKHGIQSHGSEFFSDSFAAMYGYGPDIISALAESNKPADNYEKIAQILTLPFITVMSPTHPDIVARNMNIIEQYKNTLDTDKTMSKEVKEELVIKLEEARQQMEKLKTIYTFGDAPKACLAMSVIQILHKITGDKALKSLMPKDYSFGLQKDNARVIKENKKINGN